MKTILIYYIWTTRTKIIIVLMALTTIFCYTAFSQNAKKRINPRMSLDYFNLEDNSRILRASLYVIENRERMPITNEKIYFYLGDASENNMLDSLDTNADGIAEYTFSEDYKFPIDEDRKVTITAQFNGNKTYSQKSADIDIKEILMELFLSEINGVKSIAVRGYEQGNKNEMVPIEDANVSFYIPRYFNDQLIGKSEFVDGRSKIQFPENMAGDTLGNISIIARIEDHEFYGNVERKVANFRWGTTIPIEEDKSLMTIQITIPTRALWHTNAPLWMIITLIVLLTGVWSHYVYVIINLFRLKNLSKKRANNFRMSPEDNN